MLSNLPIYFLSMLKMPITVVEKIEKIQRRFLWEGSSEVRKLHWVNWDTLKTPKDKGGLGIYDLRIVNEALLGKLVSGLGGMQLKRNGWWRKLIVHKFGVGLSEWRAHWNFGRGGLFVLKMDCSAQL